MGISASSCSPGFRGQRLSLNCFPRTVGSAPHQGACADLNRGCTWACRRLRRACSCSVRVSTASCGVHYASTSNVLRRASTGTNVLGASACSLCRTYFYRDRCLRFSPCRAHRPTVCTCTCGRLHCVNTSSVRGTCTCHGVHRVAPAVYVTSAPMVESTRRLRHIRCTCACRGVHHVSTISVLRRASTGTVYFVPAPVSYDTYCDCNRWLRFWLMFCLVALSGQFSRILAHRLSLQ